MDYDDMCEMLRILTIPLGPMAADAITALQARIAELEAELSRQNEANDMLAEERDAFWKSQSYWMASQKDEQQRAERAEADLAALVELGKERDYAMEMVNVQDGQIDALRALLKVARDCIYSLDAREIYDDELARIDAALAKGKA